MTAVVFLPLLAGHSVLAPAGPQAARIDDLWWLMLWVSTAVFLLVMAALAAGLIRRGEPARRRATGVVAGAVAVTAIILFVFLIASTATSRALAALSTAHALSLEVTGHQWWWEVRYLDPVPARQVATANEIHLPAGRPVRIRTISHDVIHSLWVPSLHGKRDLIPGHDSDFWLRADRPGVYRGQCAEYCGQQHAHMGLLVVVEEPAELDRWLDAQRRPAAAPADPLARRGQDLFLHLQCALCHTVQGTDAAGRIGPDLTHVASRRTLAAATLANTPGHLVGWLADPQAAKPGNAMPHTPVGRRDLAALTAYLESLR